MEPSHAGPRFEDARVHDVMRVGVVTCRPETLLTDVAQMMVGYDVHSIVVAEVKGDAGMWGIVTSLDLVREADKLGDLTAGEVATTELITIPADESLEQAAKLMDEHRISHLIAVQPGTDRPAGVISARGLAAAAARPS
jgi:CBS domain-containing protein